MSDPQSNEEHPTRQVPTSKRFLWGIGGFADCMMYNGVNGLVDPIYNMGISAEVIGLARSVPRFADLIIEFLVILACPITRESALATRRKLNARGSETP